MSDEVEVLPCADKLVFETVKAAQATAIVSEHHYGAKLKVYKCRHCGLYHLATAPDRSN